jgi:hypothetical protein
MTADMVIVYEEKKYEVENGSNREMINEAKQYILDPSAPLHLIAENHTMAMVYLSPSGDQVQTTLAAEDMPKLTVNACSLGGSV